MSDLPSGLFIAGSNTEVGKTYVGAMIARTLVAKGVRVGVYKPAASGCEKEGDQLISTDAVELWEAAGKPLTLREVCPQTFAAPLAPHLAARAEGKELDPELLRTGINAWKGKCDFLIVEGAGGLMSPISDDDYVIDLAAEFGFPLVVVVANEIGVINQTLQTLITAATFQEGLEIAGVILNEVRIDEADPSTKSNAEQVAKHSVPPVLDELAYRAEKFNQDIDWQQLAE